MANISTNLPFSTPNLNITGRIRDKAKMAPQPPNRTRRLYESSPGPDRI